MAISTRPLHRSYCPLSCACVGARRAAGGVLFTIFAKKKQEKSSPRDYEPTPLFSLTLW